MSFEWECVVDCGLRLANEVDLTVLPIFWIGSQEGVTRGNGDSYACYDVLFMLFGDTFMLQVSCVLICLFQAML